MADRKISDLTALTAPASGDYLPIVDISEASAANKNKRITIEELLRGAPDGTAAAPAFAFESDPNTGIYRPGADQLAIATGGSPRLYVDSSGNVGVGTTSPGAPLHIEGSELRVKNGTGVPNITLAGRNTDGTAVLAFQNNGSSATNVSLTATTNTLAIGTGGTERARIDSSGRLLVGTSSARANFLNSTSSPRLQVEGTSTDNGSLSLVTNFSSATNGAAPILQLGRSGATSIGSSTVVANNNYLGQIIFSGADGTEFVSAASIDCQVDGIPGADNMPGRLVFSTTANVASSPTERMRISNDGAVKIAGDNFQIATSKTPASATAAGTVGQIAWDANYVYVCTATNTWKRTAIATW